MSHVLYYFILIMKNWHWSTSLQNRAQKLESVFFDNGDYRKLTVSMQGYFCAFHIETILDYLNPQKNLYVNCLT